METKMRNQMAEARRERIYIISQLFYGNRTGTEISREHVGHFLRGYIGDCCDSEAVKDVNCQIVHVPNSENVVIVYDQTQEDQYVNVEFPKLYAQEGADYMKHWGEQLKMHVSCEIPEIGLKIHTRCFACRIDENGILQSLEEGDEAVFMHYFPVR